MGKQRKQKPPKRGRRGPAGPPGPPGPAGASALDYKSAVIDLQRQVDELTARLEVRGGKPEPVSQLPANPQPRVQRITRPSPHDWPRLDGGEVLLAKETRNGVEVAFIAPDADYAERIVNELLHLEDPFAWLMEHSE